MKIAVASGKGGTGKTTVAVNLALVAGRGVRLLDCDVEEPNAHIFLAPQKVRERVVSVLVPEIDAALCDGCALCAQACEFNALVSFGTVPVFSPEMCHGCGVCRRVCPKKAIREVERRIGVVETATVRDGLTLVTGRLDVGVALAPPLIRAVKDEAGGDLTLFDAPPGTSCPVVATLRDADFVVLVTEPTPFGLHDLTLAVDVVRELKLPFGVVINRDGGDDAYVKPYLEKEGIALLAVIPDDRRVAEAYAHGAPMIEAFPEYKTLFADLLQKIREAA